MRLLQTLGISLLAASTTMLLYALNTPLEERGIYPHPEGEAVYLVNEGCTINAVSDPQQFQELLEWCGNMHNRMNP